MTLFHDDMALYCPAPSAAELRDKLNVDLQNKTQLLSTYKLSLNVEKSKLLSKMIKGLRSLQMSILWLRVNNWVESTTYF